MNQEGTIDEHAITFVTAFLNLYPEKPYANRNLQWRFEKFADIAETGIPICVFVDQENREYLEKYVEIFPNIHILKTIEYNELWAVKHLHSMKQEHLGNFLEFPKTRNLEKDTEEYILFQHSKIEFIQEVMNLNPFQSTHFSWIDFNVSHIFQNIREAQYFLKYLGKSKIQKDGILIPGCWHNFLNKDCSNIQECILEKPNWRFCGGFFLGDSNSLNHFNDLYRILFPEFLAKYKVLVWEINFWCWLEQVHDWKVSWYYADHNDSIVKIPFEYTSMTQTQAPVQTLDLPRRLCAIEGHLIDMHPSSSSFLELPNGIKLLNTRYVNYRIADNGCYLFDNNPSCRIITKNVCSFLDDSLNIIRSFDMMESMDDAMIERRKGLKWIGIEDIRLYLSSDGTVRFIGSSCQFNEESRIEMVIGKYDYENGYLHEYQKLESPYGEWCEKNWSPIKYEDNDCFIYKWWPMEIGKPTVSPMTPSLNTPQSTPASCTTTLKIIKTINTEEFPLFRYFRGSTAFQDMGDGTLMGLVHFSQGESPRYYYHVIVVLDKATLQPLRHSDVFYFRNLGVEFCIGFHSRSLSSNHINNSNGLVVERDAPLLDRCGSKLCLRTQPDICEKKLSVWTRMNTNRLLTFWVSQFDRNAIKLTYNLFV